MSHVCEFCKSTFSLRINLLKHQKKALYCLRLRGESPEKTVYSCSCGKSYTHGGSYERHKRDCEQQSKADYKDIVGKYEVQQDRFLDLISSLQQTIETLSTRQPTNIVNNNVALQNMAPLTDEDLRDHLENLTLNFIQEGAKGFAEFANSYPFKNRILCTDKSRKKLKYKNENGEIVDDNRGLKLAQRFFRVITPHSEELINTEYRLLQKKVQQIAEEGRASTSDLTTILTKATRLQEILVLCHEAARGKENELTQEFISHLSKML